MSSSAIIVFVCSITLLWGGFAVCLKIAMKDKK